MYAVRSRIMETIMEYVKQQDDNPEEGKEGLES